MSATQQYQRVIDCPGSPYDGKCCTVYADVRGWNPHTDEFSEDWAQVAVDGRIGVIERKYLAHPANFNFGPTK